MPGRHASTLSLRGAQATKQSILLRGNTDCFACARNPGIKTLHNHPPVMARLNPALHVFVSQKEIDVPGAMACARAGKAAPECRV